MCTYGAFIASPTPAPQSQPNIRSPISATAEEQDTNGNMHLWLLVLIIVGSSFLYYQIRKWRNQPQRNDEYEVVEIALTQNEPSDNPLIHRTTAQSPEESSEH